MNKVILGMAALAVVASPSFAVENQRPVEIRGGQAEVIYRYLTVGEKSGPGIEGVDVWEKEASNILCRKSVKSDFGQPHGIPLPPEITYDCELGVSADGYLDRYLPFGPADGVRASSEAQTRAARAARGPALPVRIQGTQARSLYGYLDVAAQSETPFSASFRTTGKHGVTLACYEDYQVNNFDTTGGSRYSYNCEFDVYSDGTVGKHPTSDALSANP